MANTELWQLTAAQTAEKTRAGDITAEDAVGAAIARMEAVNPGLNAVVDDLSGEALERARALDAARAGGAEPGPLFGVPVTIKVNVDQAGHATTNGVPAFKDLIAPADAPLVANLQDAGAVVIGRTNTPEFSFRADTDNPLHGRTVNPWGAHISPGGSSGGAGSAVMAGMGALAHGNDAVMAALPADAAVFAAAVADWRVASASDRKLKKTRDGLPVLEFAENPDILATVSKLPTGRPGLVVGFAAETDDVIDNATAKRLRKGCDWIVANDVSPATGIMGGQENAVTLITADGAEDWPRIDKTAVAARLADRIADSIADRIATALETG